MLAQLGRRVTQGTWYTGWHSSERGAVGLREHLEYAAHDAAGDPNRIEPAQPIRCRSFGHSSCDGRDYPVTRREAASIGAELLLLRERVETERACTSQPRRVGPHRDHQRAIRRVEQLVGNEVGVCVPPT